MLKLVGAACLVYLGVRSLLDARRAARASVTSAGAEPQAPITSGRVPPAVDAGERAELEGGAVLRGGAAPVPDSGSSVAGQVIVLGLLDVALGLIWWAVFVLAIRRVTALLGGTLSQVVLDRVSESLSSGWVALAPHGTIQAGMVPARGSSRIGPPPTRVSGSR